MPRKKKTDVSAETAPRRGRPRKVVVEEPVPVPMAPTAPVVPEESEFEIKGPEIRDGFVHLSRMDLLEFELRQSRILALQSRRRLMRYEFDEVRRQQERALLDTDARLKAESEGYTSYKKKLGETYAVDFDTATYDDSTGRLLIEGAPLLAPD